MESNDVSRYAGMLAAMGTEPRLCIMRLLLAAHPQGMVVGEIGEELGMPGSSLSHHLDKLRTEGLVLVKRESTFLPSDLRTEGLVLVKRESTFLRYTANTEALRELLGFLFAECCTRNQAVEPQSIVQIGKRGKSS
jgi:ArsR family transcriptional regulator, arsenate/arsenite/antimonite-responsive transcriptional repressor